MIPFCILAIEDDSEREFMTVLYNQYNRLMYHEIYKILNDPWATEDVLQTALEKLIPKAKELRTKDRNHLINYIIATCRNTAKNYLRNTKRHIGFPFDESFDCPDYNNDQTEMEWRLIRNEEQIKLKQIWPLLDERSRYILEARYIIEKPIADIAKDLHVQESSVRMLLTRARRQALALISE